MKAPESAGADKSKRTRRNHAPGFKAKVGLAARKDEKTISEIAPRFEVRPAQVTEWRRQLLERAADVFGSGGAPRAAAPRAAVKVLHAKIGQQALEIEF